MPLRCTGEPLRISADGRAGAIRVAVVDTPGFELDQCHPIRQDVTDQEINWNGRASFAALKGKTVRLKFELDSAKLYAFSGVELLKEN
jgi:hypothetical protein